MKTSTILFIIIILMHTINLINVTLFEGEWNGIVLMLSNILFLIAVVYFGAEFRAGRSRRG
ncbi:hypothetical protein [Bacillus sp. FJAT-27251]|uniref:hypothetical protein n=1 Tax=Bacillus sp. FJAT-27251 TaxID=1684142 RepID=UPI0006A7E4ED|nr:hypothetical protein [Bacillus sp. FJAT-27251]